MTTARTTTKDYLSYYKQKLERIGEDDENLILDTIHKCGKPPVTAEHLHDTGIYKSIFKLTQRTGIIAENALALYSKWKLVLSIPMKEKASRKNISPPVEPPHPIPANQSSKPRDLSHHRETGSKCPDRNQLPAQNNQLVPDSTQDKHSSHRSRNGQSSRAFKGHPKDPSAPGFQAARPGNSSHRGSKQRGDLAIDAKTLPNPSHRSSDSDSEKGLKLQTVDSERHCKLQATSRAYFTPCDEVNIFGNPCPRIVTDNLEEIDRRFNLSKKEPFASETSAISNCGDPERSSEQKYFPVPDTTRPSSGSSELNGIYSGQDSNHTDIDSLSNPNLDIDGTPTEKLNSFADSNPDSDSSPTKKLLEPYYIEMKEGMFQAVKNHDDVNSKTGHLVFELIHAAIIKGNYSYRKDDKFDDQKCNEAVSLPKEFFGDGEKPKHVPVEPKPNREKSGSSTSGSSKHDLKRKASSPCSKDKRIRLERDSDHRSNEKRFCPDSSSDQKVRIKKEEKSPSQAYKPVNHVNAYQSNCDRNKNSRLKDSPEDAAMEFISSKKERRSIYSGKKCVQDVSSLQSFCQRFLKKNLDCIRGPKKVPYEVLQPILETLNPQQLSKIEEHNPYILPHTNGLWKQHTNRDYRCLRIMKHEKDVIWKDEYNRAHDQQKKKLKNLTASINASSYKARPDRQAKLTLVDTQHDPLRRRSKAVEVPIMSLKPTNFAMGPKASSPATSHNSTVTLKSSPSPTPKPIFVTKPSMPIIITKQKEAKHPVPHKPVKKVVAPLMSKVKKSMGLAYRQK